MLRGAAVAAVTAGLGIGATRPAEAADASVTATSLDGADASVTATSLDGADASVTATSLDGADAITMSLTGGALGWSARRDGATARRPWPVRPWACDWATEPSSAPTPS
ncbi:hypothetical protein [Streptomyces sp. NPDC051677]|uniref:hypothetical protein n=1 Tax=Streptomyces sp. NPDC051677 TaxID=3365669 RepID=UPI0037D43406